MGQCKISNSFTELNAIFRLHLGGEMTLQALKSLVTAFLIAFSTDRNLSNLTLFQTWEMQYSSATSPPAHRLPNLPQYQLTESQ